MATWGPIQLRLKGSRQVEFDGEASPAPGGGSMAGAVVLRRSAVLDYTALGYDSGTGFAIFDTGIALAAGEEVLVIYAHKATEFKSATGVGTDFTFAAYSEATASDQLGQFGAFADGTEDAVTAESTCYNPDVGNMPYFGAIQPVVGAAIDAPCNVFGYISGKNEALTQGQVQYVVVVATA